MNEPAFPITQQVWDMTHPSLLGLTKRELFAAMAMQGLCANPKMVLYTEAKIASFAILQADALIAELNKEAAK